MYIYICRYTHITQPVDEMPGGTTLTQLDRRIDKQKDRPVDRQKSRCTNIYLSMNSLFSVGRVDARVSPLHRRLCAPPTVLGKLGEKTQQRQTPYELSLSLSLCRAIIKSLAMQGHDNAG